MLMGTAILTDAEFQLLGKGLTRTFKSFKSNIKKDLKRHECLYLTSGVKLSDGNGQE